MEPFQIEVRIGPRRTEVVPLTDSSPVPHVVESRPRPSDEALAGLKLLADSLSTPERRFLVWHRDKQRRRIRVEVREGNKRDSVTLEGEDNARRYMEERANDDKRGP